MHMEKGIALQRQCMDGNITLLVCMSAHLEHGRVEF